MDRQEGGPMSMQGQPPSARSLLRAVMIALAIAGVLLVTVILPAEYGVDPTGAGRVLGLAKLRSGGSPVVLKASPGANQAIDISKLAAANGEPIPLPNPAVHQGAAHAPATKAMTIDLPFGAETEVKAVMRADQVILYSWHTDGAPVYVDFHGHSPDWTNKEAFVRYQEAKDGLVEEHGSLVAPFAGEHGWYWVNISDHPVRITLNVTGYFDEIKDYGLR